MANICIYFPSMYIGTVICILLYKGFAIAQGCCLILVPLSVCLPVSSRFCIVVSHHEFMMLLQVHSILYDIYIIESNFFAYVSAKLGYRDFVHTGKVTTNVTYFH